MSTKSEHRYQSNNTPIDEHKARISAFIVLFLGIGFLLGNALWVPVFLFIDFLLRASPMSKFSPIGMISTGILKIAYKLKPKLVDGTPKRFASLIGAIFSGLILVTRLAECPATATELDGFLVVLSALESLAGFCFGCFIYTLFKYINTIY